VLLSTDYFVKSTNELENLKIRISFRASPAIFESSDANAENEQLSKQSFTTMLKKLDEGLTKAIKVGVVGKKDAEFVNTLLFCKAN
jgi:hypothetical protein